MSRDTEASLAMSRCLKAGIKVYPIYIKRDTNENGRLLKANNWYIQVDNNGKIKTYEKSIGVGTVLSSETKKTRRKKNETEVDDWGTAIKKVYIHWDKLIQKAKKDETNKGDNN